MSGSSGRAPGDGTGSGTDPGEAEPGDRGGSALVRRATEHAGGAGGRVRLRAALALEQSGELREAARMFEQIGEHAQAAALRLEHAETLKDIDARLAALREGAVRNFADTAQGRELQRALARALLSAIEVIPDGMRRRAMLFEAAEALERADEAHDAGMIYERMGLLRRAARAYEAAGSLGPLEVVLSVLERHAEAARAQRDAALEVNEALLEGRRALALDLLAELAPSPGGGVLVPRESDLLGEASDPQAALDASSFARRLAQLERARPARRRLDLLIGRDHDGAERRRLIIHGAETFRVGRAPDADITLPAATLSREHARLVLEDVDGAPRVAVEDLGSKVGTFLDGVAVTPAAPEPLWTRGELALGMAASIEVRPLRGSGALLDPGNGELHQFMPLGGEVALACLDPAWDPALDAESDEDDPVPERPRARVEFGERFIVLAADPDTRVWLGEHPLGPGARVELLVGDRLSLRAGGDLVRLEVTG